MTVAFADFLVCPLRCKFHNFSVLSSDPVNSMASDGWKATDVTASKWLHQSIYLCTYVRAVLLVTHLLMVYLPNQVFCTSSDDGYYNNTIIQYKVSYGNADIIV